MTIDRTTIDMLEEKYGPVPGVLSKLIRPTLIAKPGKTLVWGDWSAIEARTLPWLSGSRGGERVLDVFRTNDRDPDLPDIYKIEAGNIYGIRPEDASKDERQAGKVAVLALGYGGAEGALGAMAAGYGLNLDATLQTHIVKTWRAANGWAVNFWDQLITAFENAHANPGEVFTAGRVAYVFLPNYLKGTMLCYLPDGRPLSYPMLRWEKVKTDDIDNETGEPIYKHAWRYNSGYGRKSVWPGLLAENITQGFAASLLRALLVRLERDVDYPGETVGHTHDEAITEALEADEAVAKARLKAQMEIVPDWAEGLPLVAEVSSNWYYTKVVD